MKKYQIIYADPPWEYSGNAVIAQKSLINNTEDSHYMPMSLKGIKDLNVNNITDDNALLFLWATSPRLPFAIETIISWGFQYSTVGFVWNKEMTNPGFYTLSSCEICLIGKKGKIPTPRGARNIRQFLSEKRTEHSKKPDEIRNQIVKMFPTQNKIELFARQKTDGWDVWGNEVESDIAVKETLVSDAMIDKKFQECCHVLCPHREGKTSEMGHCALYNQNIGNMEFYKRGRCDECLDATPVDSDYEFDRAE